MPEEKRGVKKLKARNSRKLYLPIYLMILVLFLTASFIKMSGKEINDLVFKAIIIFSLTMIILTEIHRLEKSYEVNSHSLISSKGILNKTTRKVDLLSLSDVDSNQNLWQRILGYGNVSARMFSKESATSIKNINNPVRFADFLEKMMSERRESTGG